MGFSYKRASNVIADTTAVDNSDYTWFAIADMPWTCRIRQLSFAFGAKDAGDTSVTVMIAEDTADAKFLLNHGLTVLTQTLAADTVPPTVQIPLDLFYQGHKGWSASSVASSVSPVTLYVGIKTNSAGTSTIRDALVRLYFDDNH